ncbi:MAG: SusD/RagB family nutrient-binding outer membrane lipoprotein [Bacteroidota bacterium]|nr:SusD/RagB family nutrient-binding outer membrane lipoprotein [Bacteroidota bacterium]
MRQPRTFKFVLSALVALFLASCDTWESGINIDPNNPPSLQESETADYNPSQFMLDMIGNTINGWDYIHWNVGAAVCEYHGKTISLSQGNRHQAWHAFDDSDNGGPWVSGYNAVRYIKKMQNAAIAMNDKNYLAIANIWECYNFFNLTLLYGDIPYTETMLDNAPIDPVYDKQKDIYFTLMRKLKAAGLMIDKGETCDAETDLIFGGDMTKWKKFANTLLIRYAMYMSDAAQDSAKAILNEVVSNPDTYPVMASNADNAFFHYDGNQYKSRCYRLSASKMDEAPFSNIFVERLISLNDPRLPVYARPALMTHTDATKNVLPSNMGTEKYAGHLYGITTDNAYASSWNAGANYASKLGEYFRTEDDKGNATSECASVPLALATYSEMLSFLAEATQKGWIYSGSMAKELYEKSIRASFDQYNATFKSDNYKAAFGSTALTSADDYLIQPQVNFEGGRDKLLLIAEQKWIASFLLMFEPYFDHRRTMLPPLRASSGAMAYSSTGSATHFPSRSDYPSSELSTNAINVANANATAFDIPVTGQENRNLALMWLLQAKGSAFLQMPVFQEPNYKSEYPCREGDADYGTAFTSWYANNWDSMYWWKNNDK